MFVHKYKQTPDKWINGKLDEVNEDGDEEKDLNNDPLMQKFIKWTAQKLNLQMFPEIEFSYDTEEAQEGHHTGRHTDGDNKVWVYAKNRNMVDIMRTVFHELVHCRQICDGKPNVLLVVTSSAEKAAAFFGHKLIAFYTSLPANASANGTR